MLRELLNEAERHIRLPEFYKNFLTSLPLEQIQTLSGKLQAVDLELLDDALALSWADLEKVNQQFQECFTSDQEEEENRHFFAIGRESGYPNFYLIALDGSSENVFFFDHEDETQPRYKSLQEFFANIIENAEAASEDRPSRSMVTEEDSEGEDDDGEAWNPRAVIGNYPKKSKYRI